MLLLFLQLLTDTHSYYVGNDFFVIGCGRRRAASGGVTQTCGGECQLRHS